MLLPEDLHAFSPPPPASHRRARVRLRGRGRPPSCRESPSVHGHDEPRPPAGAGAPYSPPALAATAAWQQQLCALWPHDPGVSGVTRSTSRSCSSTAAPTQPTRQPTSRPRRAPPCPTPCWSRSRRVGAEVSPHRLPAQSSAFSSCAADPPTGTLATCTRTLAHKYPAFPASAATPRTAPAGATIAQGAGRVPQIRWQARLPGLPPDGRSATTQATPRSPGTGGRCPELISVRLPSRRYSQAVRPRGETLRLVRKYRASEETCRSAC